MLRGLDSNQEYPAPKAGVLPLNDPAIMYSLAKNGRLTQLKQLKMLFRMIISSKIDTINGHVAQLARALLLHRRGQEFKSLRAHRIGVI